ncbi:MAG: phage terminase large subunit [Acetobacteraceae bacterium]
MPNSIASSKRRTKTTKAEQRGEKALRERLRGSLRTWSELGLESSGLRPAAHHLRLIEDLEATAAARSGRLLVHMPPGAAKSTYASVMFPSWWLACNPGRSLIAAYHTRQLAEHFGRQVRSLLDEHGRRFVGSVCNDQRAAQRFATTAGSLYYATGVNGPVVGRRADLLLIDDPVRNQTEADSAAARERLWDWFRGDLISRLRPGGSVVLVMTRWHPDDLGGRLAAAGGWRTLILPAIAEADDPLGRPPGAPLWPEWEDAAALDERRQAVGERAWAALYQQRPHLRRGGVFTTARIPVLSVDEAAPLLADAERVRAWDLAATEARDGCDPDWTAGVSLARTRAGGFVVLDVQRLRRGPAAVEAAICATAARDGSAVAIGLPQDPGQAGRAQIGHLVRQLAGFRVRASTERGAKEARAAPVASQVEAGNLSIVQAPWNATLLEELEAFPVGAKDDQVDALSRAFAMLVRPAPGARRRTLPSLAR